MFRLSRSEVAVGLLQFVLHQVWKGLADSEFRVFFEKPKNAPRIGSVRHDSTWMERRGQSKGHRNSRKPGNGKTVCAVCGQVIKEAKDDQPTIYSICAGCKKLPHRHPGSTASLN